MNGEREGFRDLEELFQALVAKLDEIKVELRGQLSEYRRGSTPFAILEDQVAELRLHPDVAEAARRTPSTTGSSRGAEWVRFAPPELDQHALDRAQAWFLSAWRAAGASARRD